MLLGPTQSTPARVQDFHSHAARCFAADLSLSFCFRKSASNFRSLHTLRAEWLAKHHQRRTHVSRLSRGGSKGYLGLADSTAAMAPSGRVQVHLFSRELQDAKLVELEVVGTGETASTKISGETRPVRIRRP